MKTAYWQVRKGYPLPDCEQVWKTYGVRTAWSWALVFGFFPFIYATTTLFESLRQYAPFVGKFAFPLILLYAFALMIVSNLQWRFRCPQCGARFNALYRRGVFGGMARDCYNCGLKKYQCPEVSVVDSDPDGIVIRPRH